MQGISNRDAPPSVTGMLIVLILVTAGTSIFWGAFSWPGLMLMVGATALAFVLHVRRDLRGPAPEAFLTGLLIAFAAATFCLRTGQGQTGRVYTLVWGERSWDKHDLDAFGLAVQFLAGAALLASFGYLLRVREALRRRLFFVLILLAVAMQALMLFSTPEPRIDVFFSQTAAGQGLPEGRNIYAMVLPSPYANQKALDHYGYPPLTVYMNTISWHLFKDVRGIWIACILASALMMYGLARRTNPGPPGKRFAELVTLCYLFLPRTLFVVEQSWTEPLTAVTLAGFALAVGSGRGPAWTGAWLGLWLNSKQYAVLAIPFVFKLLPRRWKVWAYAVLVGVAVTAPFALWNFPALYRAVFGFFVSSMGRPDGLSLYSALLWAGVELQWWMTVPLWLAGWAFFTWRMPRHLPGMLFATASMWLFFFLFGKQAFMNYFYVISLAILLAVAATPLEAKAGSEYDGSHPRTAVS